MTSSLREIRLLSLAMVSVAAFGQQSQTTKTVHITGRVVDFFGVSIPRA
jgi:hypothetical protein